MCSWCVVGYENYLGCSHELKAARSYSVMFGYVEKVIRQDQPNMENWILRTAGRMFAVWSQSEGFTNYQSSTGGNATLLTSHALLGSHDVISQSSVDCISLTTIYISFSGSNFTENRREKFLTHLMWDCRVRPETVWKLSIKGRCMPVVPF